MEKRAEKRAPGPTDVEGAYCESFLHMDICIS